MALILMLLAAPGARAETCWVLEPPGQVSYEVRARLFGLFEETITGRHQAPRGSFRLGPGGATGEISVTVADFDSGIRGRDRHVAALLGDPLVRFSLTGLDEPTTPAGTASVRGLLHMHGHTLPLELPVQYQRQGDRVGLRGMTTLRFAALGLEPPVLGGVVKRAADTLLLRFELTARSAPTPAATP